MKKTVIGIEIALLSINVVCAQEKTEVPVQVTDSLKCEKEETLEEVAVVAHIPVVKMKSDKMTYQVKNDVNARTQTVLQMLRKVPMVTVDGKNNITVNGSREFKVYVDGRLSTMITRNPSQVLRNMPASGVQSIEVITNPGARYDAEGVGGVLNIITRKKKNLVEEIKELSGTIGVTAGLNNQGMEATLNGQRNRFSFDLNLMGDYTYYRSNRAESSVNQKGETPMVMNSWQDTRLRMPFYMGELGMGYRLDSVSELHLNFSMSQFGMKDWGTPHYRYSGGAFGQGLSFQNDIDNRMKGISYDGSVDYQRFFGLEKTGSMTLTYQISHNPVHNDNIDRFHHFDPADLAIISSRQSVVREKNVNHQWLSDFVFPFSKKIKLDVGTKFTLEQNSSNSADNRADGSGDAVHYRQRQGILALYGEWDMSFGWLNLKPGVRYEHTWQDTRYLTGSGHDYRLDYGLFVPSIGTTATLNENQNIGLNYNMRIRRPGIEELDPYKDHSDPSSISYGNPNLDAEKTHNLAFVYTLAGSRFSMSATLRHSFSDNAIQQYSFYLDNVLNTTFGNMVRHRLSALNLYINWSLTSSTRMLLNAEGNYADFRSQALDARNHGWHLNVNYGIQQNLPWHMKLTANLELMTREYALQGWSSGMAMCSASLSKSFLQDKWNVTLSGVTGIGHNGSLIWKQYSEGSDFSSVFSFREPVKNISVGISYNFGGKKYDEEKFNVSLHQRKKRR